MTTIHDLAREGKTNELINLIAHGADVNVIDSLGFTPLHLAAFFGHTEIVKILIAHGADVNFIDENGVSSLHIAAQYGHAETVKTLIAYGADVNAKDDPKCTPLYLAVKFGHTEIVKTLIAHGADVSSKTFYCERTPLHIAANEGHAEAVKILIAHGAEVNAKDYSGGSSLHIAAQNGHAETVKTLIAYGADVNAKDDLKCTPLYLAVKFGHTEIVKTLIAHGADVSSKTFYRELTPLHIAANEGHTEAVKILIAHGADVNFIDENGVSSLHIAAQNGHAETVKTLIAYGANVNAKDNLECTSLYLAAKNGCPEIVKTLIAHGADVNSALDLAAKNGYAEIVKTLIAHGADVNFIDENGVSSLHIAAQNGHAEMVKTLIAYGADVNVIENNGVSALYLAAQNGHAETVKTLIAHGADVSAKDKIGGSSLHIAAQNGHAETVKTLIAHGADVNVIENNGVSALYLAAQNGHAETVKTLIAHGADVNAKDYSGGSSLHIAAQNGHAETVKTLIAHGADVNFIENNGVSALHLAAFNGHAEIVKILIAHGADVIANYGVSALYLAAQNGHAEIVKTLIAYGADVNVIEYNGLSALHVAAFSGGYEISKTLITQGSNINAKNIFGQTPLFLAVQQGCGDEQAKHLLSLPNIQVNEIGPQSLLSFYANDPEMTALLRAKGVLEHRATNADGIINYNARGQSIHSARTEETVKQTFDNLMQGRKDVDIESSFKDFQCFLNSDTFSNLAKEISCTPYPFGADVALRKAISELNARERYDILIRDIPSIIKRVNHSANSTKVKDDFKKALSLIWLTLQQDEGWKTLKGLTIEEDKAKERHELMLTFIKGLFDIQHEYFRAGNSLSDAPHAACAPGTVNHALAIFSQQHDKILVTDEEPTPAYDPNGSIKDRLMADDYQRLKEILKTTFAEGFMDLEEALSGSSDTIPVLTKEMIDTFFRPNYTNEVIEGRPTLIPEHTKLLESLLGKVKEHLYTQLNEFTVPDNLRNITDAFIGLEDALDQMPVQKLCSSVASITPKNSIVLDKEEGEGEGIDSSMGLEDIAPSSCKAPVLLSNYLSYNKFLPATIEQVYRCCQDESYIQNIVNTIKYNSESKRLEIFKEAIIAHPEYLNQSWFTVLPIEKQETINNFITQSNNKTDVAKPAI